MIRFEKIDDENINVYEDGNECEIFNLVLNGNGWWYLDVGYERFSLGSDDVRTILNKMHELNGESWNKMKK